MFILILLQPTNDSNVSDLSTPMYFVRHNSLVLMGFSGATGCLAALSFKAFQANACEKCLKIGGDTYDKNETRVMRVVSK